MKPYVFPASLTALTLLGLALSRSGSGAKPPAKPPEDARPEDVLKYAQDILARVAADPASLASLDPVELRALAKKLSDMGYPTQASNLYALATQLENMRKPPPVGGDMNPSPEVAYLLSRARDLMAEARKNLRGVNPAVMVALATDLEKAGHRTTPHALRIWAKCAADAIANPNLAPAACGPYPYTGQGAGKAPPPAGTPAPAPTPGGGGVQGVLPEALSDQIAYVLDKGIPQASLNLIDKVISELAKYQGFEFKKEELRKRKLELKQAGL